MTTYVERFLQYVVERHEEVPENQKALYRLNGVNPDNCWSLIYSFNNLESTNTCCNEERTRHEKFCIDYQHPRWATYRVRDLGGPIKITRQTW